MEKLMRMIGVMDEAPFDSLTWSGSSKHFFGALKTHGVLVDALSAEPNLVTRRLAQLISFYPEMNEWKRRYHLNTFLFNNMSRRVGDQLCYRAEEFNVLLQVGAWYDFSNYKSLRDKFRCSYHDGNLAAQIRRGDSTYRLELGYVRRAFHFEKSVYDSMDCIFPMSEWLRKIFIEDFGCDHEKVIAVGAGINLEHVPEIRNKDYTRPNILFIGIDFERKGGRTLLEAFKKVRREIPKAKLTIIGPELKDLPEGVTSLGRIKKNTPDGELRLHEAYLDASLFVMPSYYEPFGIVFAEAMAHKLPCIGTETCAMPEIIDDGKNGFIVPLNDSVALADRIIELLKDDKACEQLGSEGYLKYRSHYTWEQVTQKIITNIIRIMK